MSKLKKLFKKKSKAQSHQNSLEMDMDMGSFLKEYKEKVIIERDDTLLINEDAAFSIVRKAPKTAKIFSKFYLLTAEEEIKEGNAQGALVIISISCFPLKEPLKKVTGDNSLEYEIKKLLEKIAQFSEIDKDILKKLKNAKGIKDIKLGAVSESVMERKSYNVDDEFLEEVRHQVEKKLGTEPVGVSLTDDLVIIVLFPGLQETKTIPTQEVRAIGYIPVRTLQIIDDVKKEYKAFSIQRVGNSKDPTHWAQVIVQQLIAQEAKQKDVNSIVQQLLNSKSHTKTMYIIAANASKMDDIFFDCLDTLYFSSLMELDAKKIRFYEGMRTLLPETLSPLKKMGPKRHLVLTNVLKWLSIRGLVSTASVLDA